MERTAPNAEIRLRENNHCHEFISPGKATEKYVQFRLNRGVVRTIVRGNAYRIHYK